MSLQELVRLCPPPASPVDAFREGRVEEIRDRYGLVLPDEYIAFGHTYGTGVFTDEEDTHDILITNPSSRHYDKKVQEGQEVIGLFFRAEAARDGLRQHGIDQRALFPLGRDTHRTFLLWVTDLDPGRWRVMVVFPEWHGVEVFDCGVCDFLTGYFTAQLTVRGWEYLLVNGRTQRYLFQPAEGP
jgi:hypothetical protein